MHKLISTGMVLALMSSSCTYSVNLINTMGTSSDVVDEDQKASADVKVDLTKGI